LAATPQGHTQQWARKSRQGRIRGWTKASRAAAASAWAGWGGHGMPLGTAAYSWAGRSVAKRAGVGRSTAA